MNKCKCNLKEWTSVVNYADNDLLLVHIYHLHLFFAHSWATEDAWMVKLVN